MNLCSSCETPIQTGHDLCDTCEQAFEVESNTRRDTMAQPQLNRILEIREDFTNETKGYHFGESNWYEPYTDNIGRLFRAMQREYGRCMSSVYVDTPAGATKCGWYFESRQQYEDARPNPYTGKYDEDSYYTRGVWVTYRIRYEADEDEAA